MIRYILWIHKPHLIYLVCADICLSVYMSRCAPLSVVVVVLVDGLKLMTKSHPIAAAMERSPEKGISERLTVREIDGPTTPSRRPNSFTLIPCAAAADFMALVRPSLSLMTIETPFLSRLTPQKHNCPMKPPKWQERPK